MLRTLGCSALNRISRVPACMGVLIKYTERRRLGLDAILSYSSSRCVVTPEADIRSKLVAERSDYGTRISPES